jgi:hypothetical protein
MSSIKEIEERRARLLALGQRIGREEDLNKMLELAQQMEIEAKELEGVAELFEAKMRQQAREPKGGFEVVLTPEQRARVAKETGVQMMTVFIADPGGQLNQTMPLKRPADIEAEALKQAKASQAESKARDEARAAAERQLHEVETMHELNADAIARMKQDPKVKEILNFDRKK